MENSRLGKLPPELRNMICTFALTFSSPVEFTFAPKIVRGEQLKRYNVQYAGPSKPTAMTRVCKQLHRETEGLFFALNDIKLHVPHAFGPFSIPYNLTFPDSPSELMAFSCYLGPVAARALTRITVDGADDFRAHLYMSETKKELRNVMKILRTQGEKLGWHVTVDIKVAMDILELFADPPGSPRTLKVAFPVSGSEKEMRKALQDFEEEAKIVLDRASVASVSSMLERCILDNFGAKD